MARQEILGDGNRGQMDGNHLDVPTDDARDNTQNAEIQNSNDIRRANCNQTKGDETRKRHKSYRIWFIKTKQA